MDVALACTVHGGAIAKQRILPGALTLYADRASSMCSKIAAEQLIPQPPKLSAATGLNLTCRRQPPRWTTFAAEKGAYVGQRTEPIVAWV